MDRRTREVAQAANVAVLSVHLPVGDIGSYVMWIDVEGDDLLMATEAGSAKYDALLVNPQVTVVILGADPYAYVEVRGRITATVVGEAADALIARLGNKYNGVPYNRPVDWAVVRITPSRERVWGAPTPRP